MSRSKRGLVITQGFFVYDPRFLEVGRLFDVDHVLERVPVNAQT